MKKQTKLAVALLAFMCVGAGTAAVATAENTNSYVMASAATTVRTITKAGATGASSATALYVYAVEGDATGSGNWDDKFTLVEGTGSGIKLNGVALAYEMKQPGNDVYLGLGEVTVAEGDILTLDGTFFSEALDSDIVFKNCGLKWNGSAWETCVVYTEYKLGELNFQQMHPGSLNMAYFIRTDGEGFPAIADENTLWNTTFSYEAGCITLNGAPVTPGVKFPGSAFVEFAAAPAEGDVLVIGGTFYNETLAAKYVINQSTFTWNGSAWVKAVPPIVYDEYTATAIGATGSSSASAVFLYPTGGIDAFPNGNDPDWANVYTFEVGSGTGLTLAGNSLSTTDIKLPGTDFFVALGATANAGDVLTVDGAYYNDTTKIKLIFDNCKLQWNGEAWVEYVEAPVVNYTEYNVTAIAPANGSSATAVYLYPTAGVDAFPHGNDDWASKYAFEAGSGAGMSLGGVALTTDDIKLPGTDLFIGLGAEAKEGDVFVIDGTYYNADKAIKLVFENCKLQWNGTAWVEYVQQPGEVEYTTYELGALKFKQMQPNADNMAYFNRADGAAITIVSTENDVHWTTAFNYAEGCVTLNGAPIAAGVKFPGDLFLELPAFPEEKDELVIGGTFYSETLAVKYVIEESTFVWNGSAWTEKGAEPKTYDLGALTFHVNSKPWGGAGKVNNQLYLERVDGEALPIMSWDHLFVAENANCFKINDVAATLFEMKSTDAGLFFLFNGLEAGDKVTIGGTFVSEVLLTTYTIEESSFVWNGTSWEAYVDYTTYEIGELMFVSFANPDWLAQVNFAPVSGEAIPIVSTENDVNWTTAFNVRQGSLGVSLNGEVINAVVKFPHDMFLDLPSLPNEGDVLVIGGTFYSAELAVEYVVTESKFIYTGETWVSELQLAKMDAKAALDKYKGTFSQENYYETEWAYFDAIIADAYVLIDEATTVEQMNAIVEDAKLAMDKVATKEEADEILNSNLKEELKGALETYKNKGDYRPAEWNAIQEIIANANTAIDAADSVTAINVAYDTAIAAIDAVKTAAQWEADEAAVAAAKAELASYKAEADYRAAEWTAIQAILTTASASIDLEIGNATAIEAIVASAKADMDAVKTAAQWEADEAVVASAKAELATYKTEANYSAAGWASLQAIVNQANAKLDAAIGNEASINEIVADAKEAMDEVLTAEEEVAAALAAAKTAAEEEVRAYYGALDHSKYDDEAETVISGYVAEVMAAIADATTAEEAQAAVAAFKAKVEAVDTNQPSGDNSADNSEDNSQSSNEEKKGCGSVVDGGLLAGVTLAAAAVAVLRKKKED